MKPNYTENYKTRIERSFTKLLLAIEIKEQIANTNGDDDDTDKIATSFYLETNLPVSIIQFIFSLR